MTDAIPILPVRKNVSKPLSSPRKGCLGNHERRLFHGGDRKPGCTVTVDEGTIDQLIIASTATGACPGTGGKSPGDSLICDAPATIEGRGRIHSAIINANNVSLEQKIGQSYHT